MTTQTALPCLLALAFLHGPSAAAQEPESIASETDETPRERSASQAEAVTPGSEGPVLTPGLSYLVGAGAGFPFGAAGGILELDFVGQRGFSLSLHASPGWLPSGGLHLWGPYRGRKIRGGLGMSTGASWNALLPWGEGSSCGNVLRDHDSPNSQTVHLTLNGGVHHDVGAPGSWALRYGAALSLVGTGCAGGIAPLPTFAAVYRF